MLARYDALNPIAIRKLIAEGAKVSYFPRDVMEAAYEAAQDVWQELSDESPRFAEIYPKWKKFQQDEAAWFKIAENALNGFTTGAVSKTE